MECGTELAPARAVAPAAAEPAPGEQRRLVTVLFADLSGYTAVAERLDHETVKALIERCLTRLATEVERFGGTVDKFIGDSVMAVFGAPVAHEDDAERAVRAALGMQAAMPELNDAASAELGVELALRVGLNTGEVLAGTVGEGYTVVGDAVNVASRLQALAPVGGILVGERTQRSSAGAIDYREVEPLDVKGKSDPVPAWEVGGLRAATPPGERRTLRTPLVGREDELSQLERSFDRVVRDGAPQLLTVVGQAGVGKTRLLIELERMLERGDPPVRVRHGRCLAFGESVVYWPLSEMLRSECGIADGDNGAEAWSKLLGWLGPLVSELEGAEEAERRLAPLARLVGAELPPNRAALEPEGEQSARESLFGAVRSVLEALAQDEPLVLAWEDIHWADEGTLDLIDYLSRWLRAPVLQLGLARDELLERRPEWGTLRRSAAVMFLEPLAADDTRELVEALLHKTGTTDELLDALAERCGGNPLFAETIVKRIAEEGGLSAAELPDTVQGLLAARLDALEPAERELVAHASVLGRTFLESALEPIAVDVGVDLEAALGALREKDLIVLGERRQPGEERELSFKHVLIRDVAYEMLPKAVRARKHAEVGAFIEGRAGERGEGIAALLAEHYGRAATLGAEVHLDESELASFRAKALESGEAAGDAASALFSNREALGHYEAAEALARLDEETALRIAEKRGDVELRLGRVEPAIESWRRCLAYWSQREQLEHVAELHRKIGSALAHKGERKAAIEQHQQGINLIKDLDPTLALVRLYEEAAWLYMQVGDNMLAIYAAEKALRLAEELGEIGAASRAHGIFGRVFGRIGDTAKARENLERAVELARGSDPTETVLALLALGHHFEHSEGDYGAAHASYLEGLALAERIGDVPAQIELQSALAQLAFYRCEWDEVQRASDASAELAEREGLVGKLCLPNTLRGLLRWRDGDFDASAQLFASAHELAEKVGWSEVSFNALLGLAATLRDRGELADAEDALATALAVCERAGLIAQSIQAHASLALVRMLAGRLPAAREAATEANALAERVSYPVGGAAAREALGIVAELPAAIGLLDDARDAWAALGRRLDAARCELLLGRRLRDDDPTAADDALARAATAYEELGIKHLAAQSRELVGAK
jgi:class 3 adenylate cyclase/tetratricopeptide (TPR) repeat protein